MLRRQPERPITIFSDAAKAAEKNGMPPFTVELFLGMLGLDGAEPDGRKFRDRLHGEHYHRGQDNRFSRVVEHLITVTNSNAENEAQAEIAASLGAAVATHLIRETRLSPAPYEVLLSDRLPRSRRPEIFGTFRRVDFSKLESGSIVLDTSQLAQWGAKPVLVYDPPQPMPGQRQ